MKENSIEEEIKIALDKFLDNKDKDSAILIVEKFILGNYILIRGGRTNIVKDSLRYILSDYKRVLEMNEVLLKENEELRKELNEENKKCMMLAVEKQDYFEKYKYHLQQNESLTRKFSNDIPVQKVKDKIEELKKNLYTVEHYETVGAINVLQELLKESEN